MTSYKPVNVDIIFEGKTESYFVKLVLNQYFSKYNIFLKPYDLGGNVTTEKIVRYLKRAKNPIKTTLVDFYGYKNTDEKTVEELENEISSYLSDNYYVLPYIQMHEIEALWFCDINKIGEKMNANSTQLEKLQAIIGTYPNPEDINNSKETAPSKRLELIFVGYDKPSDGAKIAQEIPIELYMEKCPRFKKWINDLKERVDKYRASSYV